MPLSAAFKLNCVKSFENAFNSKSSEAGKSVIEAGPKKIRNQPIKTRLKEREII